MVGPPVGPDGSPGQEDQQVGGWGLALPTSACDPAPEQCREDLVFPSSRPCRPSSLPIPPAGLIWGLTFPRCCFGSRGGVQRGSPWRGCPPPWVIGRRCAESHRRGVFEHLQEQTETREQSCESEGDPALWGPNGSEQTGFYFLQWLQGRDGQGARMVQLERESA